MLRALAKVLSGMPCLFVTLTYPATYALDAQVWKRHKAAFERRLERKHPEAGWFWRLEYQKRGAPHYHLLVYGVDWIDRHWLAKAWFGVVDSGDLRHLGAGTSISRVTAEEGVKRYVGKYVAKLPALAELPEGLDWEHVGRWWGIRHPENIPWADALRVELGEREAVHFLRFLRRKFEHACRGRVRPGYRGLTIFAEAVQIWRALPLLC